MPDLHLEGETVTFWLRVKPRSEKEQLKVHSSGELHLGLRAPPTNGKANDACQEYFARLLRVPRSKVIIVTGEKSRRKLIRIQGGPDIATKIESAIELISGTPKR